MKSSVIAVALLATGSVSASEMSLDEVIAANIEAKGGYEAIKAVDTARITGTMTMGPMAAPFKMEWKRPNNVRIEFEVQGMTGIQAFDGETGWSVMPFMGKTEPEPMAEDQLKEIKTSADLDGDLVDWKDKGHKLELLGKEDVEGTEAYRIQVTKENGDVTDVYLDSEYFLEIRSEGTSERMGQSIDVATTIGDYKEVGDLIMAHSLAVSIAGAPGAQVLTFDNIELNVDIADEHFSMPEVTEDSAASAE